MLESEEQIQVTLSLCGEDIEFNAGVLKGIPGTLVYNIPSFDSPYDLDKQDFTFQVSRKDFKELELIPNDTFVYTLQDDAFNFEVTSYVDDLTGWLELTCNFLEVIV